ncbi:hypothetical protein Tco_0147775 [Tanacetum coccineum]
MMMKSKHYSELSSGKSADEIDKETVSFGKMQLKQEDQSCVHASIELHLHVVHVVPRKDNKDKSEKNQSKTDKKRKRQDKSEE